jgi:hypothetical protein
MRVNPNCHFAQLDQEMLLRNPSPIRGSMESKSSYVDSSNSFSGKMPYAPMSFDQSYSYDNSSPSKTNSKDRTLILTNLYKVQEEESVVSEDQC